MSVAVVNVLRLRGSARQFYGCVASRLEQSFNTSEVFTRHEQPAHDRTIARGRTCRADLTNAPPLHVSHGVHAEATQNVLLAGGGPPGLQQSRRPQEHLDIRQSLKLVGGLHNIWPQQPPSMPTLTNQHLSVCVCVCVCLNSGWCVGRPVYQHELLRDIPMRDAIAKHPCGIPMQPTPATHFARCPVNLCWQRAPP